MLSANVIMLPEGRRGLKFTFEELNDLPVLIDEINPTRNSEWEQVRSQHNTKYAKKDRTLKSLKHKFQELIHKKNYRQP